LISVFPAHAPADAPFVQEFSAFLKSGFDGQLFTADAAISASEDLISAAERGLAADVLVLVISPSSSPPKWPRDRWEPILMDQALEQNTRVAVFLLEECQFPQLLRRKVKFFDATASRLAALRLLKRWLWSIQLETGHVTAQSPELEPIYRAIADRPGTFTASGEYASRFVAEAAGEFEVVAWVPSHHRTLAQIAGELGAQLKLTLDSPLEESCAQLKLALAPRRCLVVFDAPQIPVDSLIASGRTSYLFTSEPVRVHAEPVTMASARLLVSERRYPEAYDALYQLFNAGLEPENCARELIWICEHWGRIDEANGLRAHISDSPLQQMRLF
jgi:hypothetical protein